MSEIPKIIILVPCFQRPLLTKFCFEYLSYFKENVKEKWLIEIVVIISPEDDSFEELEQCANSHNFFKYYYKNFRLGSKMNAGIGYVLDNFDFDYLMNFGSDDLIHPNIVDLYKPFILNQCQFFGINKYFVYDALTSRTLLFRTRDEKTIAVGAGRMIHKSILDKFWENGIPLYDAVNRGLDSCSRINIYNLFNIRETVIDSGNFPYIVDIKTSHNITKLKIIETLNDLYVNVDTNILNQHFEIIDKISKHEFSEKVPENLISEKDSISANPKNKTDQVAFSKMLDKYNQLFNANYKNEYKEDSQLTYLFKLYNDLFYGMMLENMHQESAQVRAKEKEIQAIYNSSSWKITAPLRYIHSKLFS